MKLGTIIREKEKEYTNAIARAFKKELGVKKLTLIPSFTHIRIIEIDGHKVTNIEIDSYNNLSNGFSRGIRMPIEYLPKFGRILSEVIATKDSMSQMRPYHHLYIQYFERYINHITLEEIHQMMKESSGDDGFRKWVLSEGVRMLKHYRPEIKKTHLLRGKATGKRK